MAICVALQEYPDLVHAESKSDFLKKTFCVRNLSNQ